MIRNNANPQQAGKEKLIADFQAVVADSEELLGATASQGGDKVAAIRARMTERLADAKLKLSSAEKLVIEKTKATAKATDEYVRENPWQSVLIAGGVGFALGFVVNRLLSSSKS